MSLSSLRSEVSRLESKLSHEQSINRELRGELATIANGVTRATNELEGFNAHIQHTLDDSTNQLATSHQRVVDSIALQGEIEKLYERYKTIELANKKIRVANVKKFYDFANYRTVRKIVQGIMDNLDMHMVSDKTITKSVEVQHLQTPDYWLTCALISIMAWKNDDKPLADRAMARAVSLDKKHSAIFYMLFNLRMPREEAAVKWFLSYRECEQKGSDRRTFLMLFSLVSKAMAETVDGDILNQVFSYIRDIIHAGTQAAGYSEGDIIAAIRYQYTRLQLPEQMGFPLLRKYCEAHNDLEANLTRAKNNIPILEFILKTINIAPGERNEFLKNYIDEMISDPNEAEQSVYDEIAYNELIIQYEGDTAAAKTHFDNEKTRAEAQINLMDEMVLWIFEKDNRDINQQMRLNMFTLTKALQEKAIIESTEDYRRRKTSIAPIRINDYITTADFTQAATESGKIEVHYKQQRDQAFAEIKDWHGYVGFGIAGAAAIGGIAVGTWLFAFALIGAGFGAFKLLANKAQRNQLELECADHIRTTDGIWKKLCGEFQQYQAQFDEHDQYHDRIMNELGKV